MSMAKDGYIDLKMDPRLRPQISSSVRHWNQDACWGGDVAEGRSASIWDGTRFDGVLLRDLQCFPSNMYDMNGN